MSKEENEEGAQVIDLAALLTPKDEVDEKEEALKAFEQTLAGANKKPDYLALEEEEEEEIPNDPPEVIEVEEEEEQEEFVENKVDLKNLLLSIFDKEVPTLLQQNDEGQEVEVGIEDLDIDETLFREIIQSRMDDLKAEATEGKIPVDSISDFIQNLIEIENNGGNISQLLAERQAYSEPLDRLDLTTEEGLKQAIILKERASGTEESKIARLIRSYELDGVLEEEGQKAESDLRQALNLRVEQAKAKAQKDKEAFDNMLKTYKKGVKEGLDVYDLTDTIKNKVATVASKVENGQFAIDAYYFEKQKDPKEAADLALFLMDKELYNKQISNKKVQETQLRTSIKLGTIRKPTESASIVSKATNNGGFVDLSQT